MKENKIKEKNKISFMGDFNFKTLYMKSEDARKLINDAIKYYTDIDLNIYSSIWQEIAANDNIYEHAKRVDLNFILEEREKKIYVSIEINNEHSKIMERRNYSHLFAIAANMYDKDEKPYVEERYTYQINLDNYYNEYDKTLSSALFMMTDTKNKIKDEVIKKYHIYLPRIREICYTLGEKAKKEDRVLSILSEETKEGRKKLAGKDEELKRMVEEMDAITEITKNGAKYVDEAFLSSLSYEHGLNDGIKEGIDQGIEIGIDKGIMSKSKEIAKNMLSKKYSSEEISNITGLTIEEIKKLKD